MRSASVGGASGTSGSHDATVAVAVKPIERPQGGLVLSESPSFGLSIGIPAAEGAWCADPVLAHETTRTWAYVAGSWLSMKL